MAEAGMRRRRPSFSDLISPRFIAAYSPARDIPVRAQASAMESSSGGAAGCSWIASKSASASSAAALVSRSLGMTDSILALCR